MRIAVLGPLKVLDGEGQPVRIPAAKERLLLALLAMHAGSVVSTDRIVETLGNGEPPPRPRSRQDTRRSVACAPDPGCDPVAVGKGKPVG